MEAGRSQTRTDSLHMGSMKFTLSYEARPNAEVWSAHLQT